MALRTKGRDGSREEAPTVALVDWAHLTEDFLDNIGVSIDTFVHEMSGGWLFGYVEAMRTAGLRPVLFFVSARFDRATRFTHAPTGTPTWFLPAPRAYRAVRRRILNPYAETLAEAAGTLRGIRRFVYAGLKEAAPYLSTPLRTLARALREEECKAIVCQEYQNPRFDACVVLGRMMGLPVFGTFQGGDTYLTRIERPIRPLTLRLSAGLISGSASEARRIRSRYRLPRTKIAQIPNPLDLSRWEPIDRAEARATLDLPARAPVAIWHGRVVIPRKGLDVLIRAWARVTRILKDDDPRLLLVGSGESAGQLRDLITSMKLEGITWVERLHDVSLLRRYLSAADVYCLPSRHEGFPLAPLEAMACGLPVVATDAPGVPDIFERGEESGGVVVPRDDPGALADALVRVLSEDPLRRKLATQAIERVREAFSLESVGTQLRDFVLPLPGVSR